MIELVLLASGVGLLVFARTFGRVLRIRRERHERQQARVRALPNALILLQIATMAGRTPRGAIAALGDMTMAGDMATVIDDFAAVAERVRLGADLSDAILVLESSRSSASLVRVLDLLRRAEFDGGALGVQLELLVLEFRRARGVALDVAAQRMTVTVLFPLVLCILPAFILLAIVPLLLGALAGLPG